MIVRYDSVICGKVAEELKLIQRMFTASKTSDSSDFAMHETEAHASDRPVRGKCKTQWTNSRPRHPWSRTTPEQGKSVLDKRRLTGRKCDIPKRLGYYELGKQYG